MIELPEYARVVRTLPSGEHPYRSLLQGSKRARPAAASSRPGRLYGACWTSPGCESSRERGTSGWMTKHLRLFSSKATIRGPIL